MCLAYQFLTVIVKSWQAKEQNWAFLFKLTLEYPFKLNQHSANMQKWSRWWIYFRSSLFFVLKCYCSIASFKGNAWGGCPAEPEAEIWAGAYLCKYLSKTHIQHTTIYRMSSTYSSKCCVWLCVDLNNLYIFFFFFFLYIFLIPCVLSDVHR